MVGGIRRQARAYALQVLYAADVAEHAELSAAAASTAPNLELDLPAECQSFAETLVSHVDRDRSDLDRRIQEASKNWRLERMSRVDRNILRLAVAELLYAPDVPDKVVINEAVELAKTFGAEESPAFVNGILDRVAQDIRKSKG